ncbi:MAG: MarR family winged helix-turn-helix transcriptional regulator, partial [Mycobacteriales bacterium]
MRVLLDLRLGRDLADDAGLSEPDYDVLSTVSERDRPWRLADLVARLHWKSSLLSPHLTRMQARGRIRRAGCATDARGCTVSLTAAGRRALAAAAPGHAESVRTHLIGLLTPTQVRQLATISEKVTAHLAETGGRDPLGDGSD